MRTSQKYLPVLWMSLTVALSADCLKGDNRPVPGSVLLSVESSDGTRNGFTTSDGWSITFDRFLSAVGNVSLESTTDDQTSTCNSYSDASYDRLFDFTKVLAPEKVGIVYGLGACLVDYRLKSPSDTALLEAGASPSDLTFMRTQVTDAYSMNGRVSVRVIGHATQNGVTLGFDWDFRRGIQVTQCEDATSSGYIDTVNLKANDADTFRAVVSAEELFRVTPDDSSPFAFDLIATADANGDGTITLDELSNVPVPITDLGLGAGGSGGGGTTGPNGPNGPPPPVSLADLLYDWLLPRVTRFAGGGSCSPKAR